MATISCMKIAYIANIRLPTEKAHGYQIIKMCEALAALGHDVILFVPYRYQLSKLKDKNIFDFYNIKPLFKIKITKNIDLIPYSDNKILYFLQSFLWSMSVILFNKEKFSIYYTRDIIIAFWMSLMRYPILYEEHVIWGTVGKFFLKVISYTPTRIVVLTNFIKNEFIKLGFNSKKILIASDAVDLKMFKNLPLKSSCRQKLNLSQSLFIIGYIGRFRVFGNQEKGIPELIRATAILYKKNKNISLLLVGGPEEAMKDYIKLARENFLPAEKIEFVNHVQVNSVPYYIKACDLVTIPWTWTQFSAYCTSPLKLFEYMASKTPIVSSDLSSLREIINNNNSILVKPGDYFDLASGIEKILDNKNLANKISEQAYNDVQNYTWDNRAKKILSFLCT